MVRVRMVGFLCMVLLTLSAVPARAEGPGRPTVPSRDARSGAARSGARIEAVELPAGTAMRLDGDFSDAAWELAAPMTGFVQREPREGAAPTYPTEVRVVYDRTYLYVAVRAFDAEPDKIVGIRTRRDGESPSDWIRVVIDSYHDRRTAYEFTVNPAGVKQDAYWFNDGNRDSSWDAVWDVQVSRDPKGWKAEFRIPFSQLRFVPGKTDSFGFAIWREVGRLKETSTWPLLAKSASGFVSQFGEIGGLHLAGSVKRLELSPYSVAQVGTQPVDAGDPFTKAVEPRATLGADLKYAITPGLTLTGTINPDFGQVESDPAVVNLTAFETFYEERRPFFVEGSGTFKFDLDCNDGACTGLFYSRRIGRRPQVEPAAPDGGFVTAPAQTTILGAAKLTGRVGGFSVGALNAVTSEETGRLASGQMQWNQTVEPLTNYAIGRARREWANRSSLGFMFTATNRRTNSDVTSLADQAYTGGVDWDWRFHQSRYSLAGYWAGSSVLGTPEAIDEIQRNAVHNLQRPDARGIDYDPSRTSLQGHAGSVSFNKIGGNVVRFSTNIQYKSPGFDVNDVGYVRRSDSRSQSNWIQFRRDTPSKHFRSLRLNLNQWGAWTYAGEKRYVGVNVNAHAVFTSSWSTGMGVNIEGGGLDDRASRGGPAVLSKSGRSIWCYLQSDDRSALNGGVSSFYFSDERGSWAFNLSPQLSWRPTSFLSLTGGFSIDRQSEDAQWVDNVTDTRDHYIFGHIRQTTVSLTARVNYTVTPTLTVQIYAQPFVSAGQYDHFKELANGRASNYEDRYAPYAYAGNPDFNYRSFRSTNVIRWEYKPGSTLYVVWQQGRERSTDVGTFSFNKDFGRMLSIPATNRFLVKLAYWLNF
jgi:hypothetical protein